MTDVLDTLGSYPDDASVIMSKRVVADVIDEIARLRMERDELLVLLREAREYFFDSDEIASRIDGVLNKGGCE